MGDAFTPVAPVMVDVAIVIITYHHDDVSKLTFQTLGVRKRRICCQYQSGGRQVPFHKVEALIYRVFYELSGPLERLVLQFCGRAAYGCNPLHGSTNIRSGINAIILKHCSLVLKLWFCVCYFQSSYIVRLRYIEDAVFGDGVGVGRCMDVNSVEGDGFL